MISYIDEAGTFALKGASEHSWCTVVCYSVPEFESRKLKEILRQLKIKEGFHPNCEMKLKDISEREYVEFLSQLGRLKGSLFCVATDSYQNSIEKVRSHKSKSLASLLQGRTEMKYESGKQAMEILHSQIQRLPEQLYIQFHCQAALLSSFIRRGIAFYIQRYPNSLKRFRWQYDAKEQFKLTDFEDSFQKYVPALLQAFSIDNPTPRLTWCDYSPMQNYLGDIPEYLTDKVPELAGKGGFNVQKIIRDDIEFVDSKSSVGVQVADLLASGLRRLLRLEFENNDLVAKKFGNLLLQEVDNQPPISIIAFNEESPLGKKESAIVRIMIKNCKMMILK